MTFINTLPYVSNPVEEFSSFSFVDWESGIYPTFKGGVKEEEMQFFTQIIKERGLQNILDLGVGGGIELAGIISNLQKSNYPTQSVEANEIDDFFITAARDYFKKKGFSVPIHKANWLDLPKTIPPYTHNFDFAFLTGNSLAYIGGGSREYTKRAQQSVVSKFASLIDKDGYLFIDLRNYNYIRSLMNMPRKDILKSFTFDYSIYYHGFPNKILAFPAYISETVVVIHYYNIAKKIWSKLDLYPIYHEDIVDILSVNFEIEDIFYDFGKGTREKSLFVQCLAKRK